MHNDIQCDVCIIGSGAGGASAAHRLALEGLDVVILERGVWRDSPGWDPKLDNDELVSRVRKEPQPSVDGCVTQIDLDGTPTDKRWGQGFGLVGGSTVLYAATSWRYRREDFQKGSLYSDRYKAICKTKGWDPGASLIDWPGGDFYCQLEPYYLEVERTIGVAGDDTSDPTRPPGKRAFQPPLPLHKVNEQLAVAARDLKWQPFPIPLGIQSIDDPARGRQKCRSCGFCSGYPCVYRSKNSVDEVLLEPLRGKVRIETGVTARRILHDKGHCEGVMYSPNKNAAEERRVLAKAVLLAAGAILSPRMLQLSKVPANPSVLGKFLTFHIDMKREGVFEHADEKQFLMVKKLAIMDLYIPPKEESRFVNHMSIQTGSKSGPIGFALRKDAQDSWGKKFQHEAEHEYASTFEVQAIGEDLSLQANGIDWSTSTKQDAFGDPIFLIRHRYHPMDIEAGTSFVADHMERLIKGAGGHLVGDRPKVTPSGSHPMGTARMGVDPSDSVTDRSGRVHGMDNLYVADASLFTTSGGLNPGLTVMALGMMVGDQVASNLKGGGNDPS